MRIEKWSLTRCLHEILFACTIAFGSVSILFLLWPELSTPFVHIEVLTNRLLHVRQTDLVRGYLEFLIPSGALAACFWSALHLSRHTRFTRQLLRSAAGIMILSAVPLFWLYVGQSQGWSLGWPYMGWPIEFVAAICCAILFLYGRTLVPAWISIVIFAGHFGFWFWIRGNYQLANFAGPIAPVLAFLSSVAWIFYVQCMRRGEYTRAPAETV